MSIRPSISHLFTWNAEKACVAALEDVLQKATSNGIGVELGFPPAKVRGKRIATPVEIMNFPLVIEKIRNIVDRVSLVTAHLPMLDISSLNEATRRSYVQTQIEVIKIAYALGITRFVLHPAAGKIRLSRFASAIQKEMIYAKHHRTSQKSVDEIIETLKDYPISIAMENLTEKEGNWDIANLDFPFGQHGKLFLGICFDTLHEFSWHRWKSVDQFTSILDKYSEFIVEIHLNNGYGLADRSGTVPHRSLMVGLVPVLKIIEYLKSEKFDKHAIPVIFEVDSTRDFNTSMDVIRSTHPPLLFY